MDRKEAPIWDPKRSSQDGKKKIKNVEPGRQEQVAVKKRIN